MNELDEFLEKNPEINTRGIEVWGDEDKFRRWIMRETMVSRQLFGGRVIDMTPEKILYELHAIEHGLFF